ncbi:MAG: diaminopimelate epimerase [Candidatus Omnitrophota bacterium]|nr:diaminopimelate epimerase [Candidatus Omnitrophota bacterium]MDZ4241245.1 diaminopimelate epimerase [Candidatus Omnitrophota bacterium]
MAKSLKFTKMAGAGNDFLVVDGRVKLDYKKLAPRVCDRTNGVGADGILILGPSSKADYRMRIINADGSEAEMCGNGARCMAAYIVRNRKPRKKLFSMETMAGIILAEAKGETAHVRLSDPRDYHPDLALKLGDRDIRVHYIDTGVPHTIIYVDGLETVGVREIAPGVRYHEQFKPRGTNVNFVEQIGQNLVAVRTYERGVEDETRACGTGSVAAGIVSYLKANPGVQNAKNARMRVRTASGEVLQVTFDLNNGQVSNVWLKGSAKLIAAGEYFL